MADDEVNGSSIAEGRARRKRTRELEDIARGGAGSVDVDGTYTDCNSQFLTL